MWLSLLALSGGVCVAIQLAINAQTRTALGGPLWAALANYAVGLAGLMLFITTSGARTPDMSAMRTVPAWHWGAGLLGATFIVVSAHVGPRIGLGATFALVLAGQLATALVIDHQGWISGAPRPASAVMVLGVLLSIAGAMLVVRGR